MKYILMLTGTQADYDAMNGKGSPSAPAYSESDLKAMFDHMSALNDDLSERGELVDGQGLAEPKQARYVTASADGTPVVSDGPFGETREVLAGYWIVDVETPERAYEIAARAYQCPVPEGTPTVPPVIVRRVDEAEQAGEL
ncbi:YciI family protein [Streptomyces sp. 4N509B]|uniref:YciI family protein n=1 Tax=Streptomyces sp. 4N509B TaxID=3457413 RepID=UPI003FD2B36E